MSYTKVRPGCLQFILESLSYLAEAGKDQLYGKILLVGFAAAPYLLLYRSGTKIGKVRVESIRVADRAAS